MGQGNLPDADQHLNAMRVDHPCRTLKALHKTVNPGTDARGGQQFHQARFVGRGKNQPLARVQQKEVAGLAITVRGQLAQKVGLIQPNNTCQCADDLALEVANRHGHGKRRRVWLAVKVNAANDSFAVLENRGQLLRIKYVDDKPVFQKLHVRLQHPLPVPDHGAAIEQPGQKRPFKQKSLHRCFVIHLRRTDP